MKVIIAGGRDFNNKKLLFDTMDNFIKNNEVIEIVCGCARGADSIGEEWAKSRKISIKYFPANWNEFGKRAGFIRNHQMGNYADFLVAFWDGKSKGTKDMIDYMQKLGKHGTVIKY